MKKIISIVCCLAIILNIFVVYGVAVGENRAISVYEQSATHNTFATAQAIYQDYTLSGRITNSSEKDYYSIVFSDSGKVNFWLGNIPSGCNYNLYIYDYSYNLVGSSTSSTATQEIVSNFSVVRNRVYYILIDSNSGYSTTNYYQLRCKWYPSFGYTYYYNKNPESTIGKFSILNMEDLTTMSGYNVVDEIIDAGCFVTAYAMVLDNLSMNTGVARFNPRNGKYGIMKADPVSVTLANMGFPELDETDTFLDDNGGTPVLIRNFNNIASSFYTTFNQYNVSGMTTNQKIVAITYYLTQHPEGVVLRFNKNGSQHTLVATNSAYVASEAEISNAVSIVESMVTYDYPTSAYDFSHINQNA